MSQTGEQLALVRKLFRHHSAPFGPVGVVSFQVLPQEQGAAGEHQDENLLRGSH